MLAMTQWYWWLANLSWLIVVGALEAGANSASAQITTDRTLPNNSIIKLEGNTRIIEGGTQAGANLFHSFQEFSVPTSSTAFFNNAADIQNIISRVTGGSVSSINGVLKANGTANLFLLNPNGIIFGSNAKLNIGGSFLASTASAVKFALGIEFSTLHPQTAPLLSINVPIGLQYGSNAGSIQVQGSNLRVQTGKTLALLGGNVSLNSGSLWAPGGSVELGGLSGVGTVELEGAITPLRFPDAVARADVSLSNGALVNVLAGGGGSIAIKTRNINVSGGSSLNAGIQQGSGSVDTQAGNIVIDATEAMTLTGSYIFDRVQTEAVGKGGDINITVGSLSGTNGALLATTIFGQGRAGNVMIQSNGFISFDGVGSNGVSGGVVSNVQSEGVAKGGDISITAKSLSLTNGAVIGGSTSGKGDLGNLRIQTSGAVAFDGASSVFSFVNPKAEGNGGNIDITSESFSLTNGAIVASDIFGKGVAGNVAIKTSGDVFVDGGSSFSGVYSQLDNNGKGGEVSITARSLSLTNGGQIGVSTFGQGSAGNIKVQASDAIFLSGLVSNNDTGIFSNVKRGAVGKGGNIDITTGSLSVTNGAELVADVFGKGDGGSVRIYATGAVSFDGANSKYPSGAYSNVQSEGVGKGGEINITAQSLSVTNNAQLGGGTLGQGSGGSVRIQTSDYVFFDGAKSGAYSGVASGAVGNGGNINITTGLLKITNGAVLSATSEESNNAAGNIKVTARSIRMDKQAGINADTQGSGGNINLGSRDLIMRRGSNITTNATGNQVAGGNITINTDILAAFENSYISANSSDFRGGNVIIDAYGLFGIQLRQDTLPSNISATGKDSSLNGTVQINTPDVDPSRGLVELPINLVDASQQLDTRCNPDSIQKVGSFVVTGRGGLPPNPRSEFLSSDAVQVDWVTLNTDIDNHSRSIGTVNSTKLIPAPIVEATGWERNGFGEVVLTASAPTMVASTSWQTTASCHGS